MDVDRQQQGTPDRTVHLPDGRSLTIRPATVADVPALLELFEGLTPDDRNRRFFSGFHPDATWVTDLVRRPPSEGRLLVAELSAPSGSDVVAEAEWSRSADGDGELAMTVDRRWRGWLAPYLLDAVLEDAAAAGLPNLRAEVLAQNRPMLALLRARGCAMAETGDPCVIALVVGTLGPTPSWAPGSGHPRVVLEGTGSRWRLTSALREAGVPVLRCAGPASRPATAPCPLEAGGSCPLVDGADVVIHALDGDDPRSEATLRSHLASGVPVLEVGRQATDDEVASIVARVLAGEG
jgi:ribosomal protein S18 acetylase RimI-like enzyme